MSDDLDRLEREVESELAALAGQLPVELPGPLVLRVKAVVRHQSNEGWLADQPGPRPSTDILRRIKQAVHEELGRMTASSNRSAWGRASAVVAAAAMIALCVGVIHHAGTLKPAIAAADADAEAHVDQFLSAAERVFSDEPLTASIESDLSDVEDNIVRWRAAEQNDDGWLRDLMKEIDQKLSEPAKGKGASTVGQKIQGALG
jgi:hypothetical protein